MARYFFFLMLALNLLVSCGTDSDDDDDNPELQQEEQIDQGVFEASLKPLNVAESGSPSGSVRIHIEGDEVRASLRLSGALRSMHPQYIYSGRACPSTLEDINRDGRISFTEASGASGGILVPLDNNIESQLSGGVYPFGRNYSYFENASLTRLLSDLKSPDPIPGDSLIKLGDGESLNLEGRAVMVHGIGSDSTLPVACGLFAKVIVPELPPVPAPIPPAPPVPSPPRPGPLCPVETTFSTRLSNELLISGVRCRGGETTRYIDVNGDERIFICKRGQWLVTVDNINTCSPGGSCTEIGVLPLVAYLRKNDRSSPPDQCTYTIRPLSPVSEETRQDLHRYQVRFYDDQSPVVLPR